MPKVVITLMDEEGGGEPGNDLSCQMEFDPQINHATPMSELPVPHQAALLLLEQIKMRSASGEIDGIIADGEVLKDNGIRKPGFGGAPSWR